MRGFETGLKTVRRPAGEGRAIITIVSRLRHSEALGQLVRFGIAGAAASAIYAIVYLLLTLYVFPRSWAIAAVPPAFCVGVLFGFFAHSRWSFRGHDTRGAGPALRVRFVAVQACGFAINAIVTWIATVPLDLPAWVPLVPAVVLAAVATFLLNRFWVFR